MTWDTPCENAGEWYRRRQIEARELSEHLAELKARGASEEEIRCIERKLELARDVGD